MEIERITVDIFPTEEINLKNMGGMIEESEGEKYYEFSDMEAKMKESESRRLQLFADNVEDLNESLETFANKMLGKRFATPFITYDITTDEVQNNNDPDGIPDKTYIDVNFNDCEIRYFPKKAGLSLLIRLEDREEKKAKEKHIDEVKNFIEYTKNNPNWMGEPREYRLITEECYSFQDEIKNKDEVKAKAGEIQGKEALIFEPKDDVKITYIVSESIIFGKSTKDIVELKEGLNKVCESMGIDEPKFEYYPEYDERDIQT